MTSAAPQMPGSFRGRRGTTAAAVPVILGPSVAGKSRVNTIETGAQVYQRSLVLRAVPGKSMQGFLDKLGSVALQEGLPPQ